MNKRLRKKKHYGEYRELGFHIEIRYESGYLHDHEDDCFNQFIDELDRTGFETGGGWSDSTYDGFVSVRDSRVDIDLKKPELLENIRRQPGVISVNAGENTDAWHGSFPD